MQQNPKTEQITASEVQIKKQKVIRKPLLKGVDGLQTQPKLGFPKSLGSWGTCACQEDFPVTAVLW